MDPSRATHRLFQRVAPSRNLSQEIAERIADDITSGRLAPGVRLPTEQEMVASMGVSRTVVREAVAALRANGLVIARQGAGVFVASDTGRRPFRLTPENLTPGSLTSLAHVLNVMELRASVEAEAAGLAAERGSPVAHRRIGAALAKLEAAIDRGESAVDEDFAFHRAVAAATGNPQFSHFLEYLGHFIIPRQSIRLTAHGDEAQRAYLATIQREHRSIYTAIQSGTADAAREAMRLHLANSQARYRRLTTEVPASPPPRRTARALPRQ